MSARDAAAWEDRVRLPGRETRVLVGPGLAARLPALLGETFPSARRVGLVLDEGVAALHPPPALGAVEVLAFPAPAGEPAKRRPVLARLQDGLLALRREEPLVAVGGGAVLDVAGFAAATVRRGIPWVAVPTTVVGMADAAVGGKVAINHRLGKNLLGTFHPPALVLADPSWLVTLPPRERVAGLAEVYKAARAGDLALLASLRRGAPAGEGAWTEALARAVAVKARLVEEDERDQGRRRLLNYGHTVGHALERALGPEALRHGEAVAIGMAVAARVARARGLLDEAAVRRQDEDLQRLGLPVRPPRPLAPARLLGAVALDKKRRPGPSHVLVLPRGDEGLVVVEDASDEEIRRAWVAVGAGA